MPLSRVLTRGLGALRDHANDVADDLKHRHVGLLLASSRPLFGAAAEIDYSGFLAAIPDQGQTSSCVGQSLATSCFVHASIAGHPIQRPSAKAIYDFARLVDQPAVLEDAGSRPAAAIQGMRDYGLVAESRWPLTDANVNELPPLDVLVEGSAGRVTGHYRIPDGAGSCELIDKALAGGFIPMFAMPVDDAYMQYDGTSPYEGTTGTVRGYHAQAIVGRGRRGYLIANSWGRSWGLDGLAWIAAPFFETSAVTDKMVVTVVPTRIL